MERKYDRALRLLTIMTENASELREIFSSDNDEILTKEEQDKLQVALLKFVAATRSLTNGK